MVRECWHVLYKLQLLTGLFEKCRMSSFSNATDVALGKFRSQYCLAPVPSQELWEQVLMQHWTAFGTPTPGVSSELTADAFHMIGYVHKAPKFWNQFSISEISCAQRLINSIWNDDNALLIHIALWRRNESISVTHISDSV